MNLKQHRPDQILKITDFYIPWTYRNSDKISTLWEDQSATQNLLLNLNYAKSKQSAPTRLIHRYKWNATVREVPFELSREEVEFLVKSPCHYCGALPSMKILGKDIWSPLTYNGIDRVGNSKGYVTGNVVSCCRICNIAKRDLSVEEFLEWATRIYLHQRENRQ